MKVKEIIEDADLLVPNAFLLKHKLNWLNETQRQLFREFPAPQKAYLFETQPGEGIYVLPDNFREDRVESLYVDGIPYEYLYGQEGAGPYSFTIIEDYLFVNPEPTSVVKAFLHYRPVPMDFKETDLELEPSFLRDFHELLTLGIAKRAAERNQDYKLAGELELRFQTLFAEARKRLGKPRVHAIRRKRAWV